MWFCVVQPHFIKSLASLLNLRIPGLNSRGKGWIWDALPMAGLGAAKPEWCPCFVHAQLCAASPQLVGCHLWSEGSVPNQSLPNSANCIFMYECSPPQVCLISICNWCQRDCCSAGMRHPGLRSECVWLCCDFLFCSPIVCFICKALSPHPLHPCLSVCRENRQNRHIKVPSEPICSNW